MNNVVLCGIIALTEVIMKKFFSVFFRALFIAGALVLLTTFISTFAIGIKNVGNIVGAALCVWVILVCIKPIHLAIKRSLRFFFLTRLLHRIVTIAFTVVLVYGLIATAAIVGASLIAPKENSTVVVLGAQVRPSGEPSTILRGRISAAEDYLVQNEKSCAVLSGGKGSDEVKSEADCMYDEMVSDGIDPARLIKEDKATDTAENFRFSQEIIEKNNLSTDLAVVTDGFHQFRAKLIAQKQGFSGTIGAVSADTDMRFVPTYIAREWFALPTVLFK